MTGPEIFQTRLDDVLCSEWIALNDSTEVTRVPIWDRANGLFARLNYRDSLAAAAALGARLISRTELEEFRKLAIILGPVIQPPGPQMASRAYCERHDRLALAKLVEVDDFVSPILNLGKHWIHGAPKGRAHLMGWWVQDVSKWSRTRKGPGWIQAPSPIGGQGPHDWWHVDASMTVLLVRDRAAV